VLALLGCSVVTFICRENSAKALLQWKRIHENVLIVPIMRDMAEAYMEMRIINEKDNEGWLSSSLVGHTIGGKLEQIVRGEGEILKQAGIRMVPDLFLHDGMTGKLDFKNYKSL
jgi:hypothetical protein